MLASILAVQVLGPQSMLLCAGDFQRQCIVTDQWDIASYGRVGVNHQQITFICREAQFLLYILQAHASRGPSQLNHSNEHIYMQYEHTCKSVELLLSVETIHVIGLPTHTYTVWAELDHTWWDYDCQVKTLLFLSLHYCTPITGMSLGVHTFNVHVHGERWCTTNALAGKAPATYY